MKAYHCILDDALSYLKPGEFSIFYYIYRKTIGWNKYVDRISYNQFVNDTGLTRPTVFNNLASLEELKWIHVMRETTKGGLPYNQYSLGEVVYKFNQLQTGKEIKPILVKKLNQNKPKVVKKLNPQKIVLKDSIKDSKSKRRKKSVKGDNRILENGMTWGAFRQLLEYEVGVIKIGTEENDKYRRSLEQEPEEKLVEAVEYVKALENPPMIRYILERIHGYIQQWDYHQKQKAKAPRTAQQYLDEARQELEQFTGDPRYKDSASEQYAIDYVKTVKGQITRLEQEVRDLRGAK